MEVSGTSMRELLGSPKYKEDRESRFKKMFGYFNKNMFNLMVDRFSKIYENKPQFEPYKDSDNEEKYILQDLEEESGWPLGAGPTIGHGYPSEEDMKKIAKKLNKIRSKTDSNKKYQFDPVIEAKSANLKNIKKKLDSGEWEVIGHSKKKDKSTFHVRDKAGKRFNVKLNEGKVHRSAGIIPYIKENDELKFLLIKSNAGWGFPKGHLEGGESGLAAAKRETKEETGLTINKIHPSFKHSTK